MFRFIGLNLTAFTALMLGLTLSITISAAQLNTYTIDTQHQLANALVPTLSAMVADGGMVTSFNNTLIIKTTSENFEQIKDLLAQIDKPVQQLLISVRSSGQGLERNSEFGLEEGLIISDGRSKARVIVSNSSRTSQDRGTQKIRAIEGQAAFIQTGQKIPVQQNTYNGQAWVSSTSFKDVTQGFYVTARLSGTGVTLNIRSHDDSIADSNYNAYSPNPAIDTQSLSTQVRTRLGRWTPIGSIEQSSNDDQRRILNQRYSTQGNNVQFEIKVEAL